MNRGMRKILASFALLVLATTVTASGCGSDNSNTVDASIDAPADAAPPDAPSYDFSCMANPAPTTAPDMLTITGTVSTLNASLMTVMVDGATVDICIANCNGPDKLDTKTDGVDSAAEQSEENRADAVRKDAERKADNLENQADATRDAAK